MRKKKKMIDILAGFRAFDDRWRQGFRALDGDNDDSGKTKGIDIYETYFDSDSCHDLCLRLWIVYRIS